MNGCIFAFGMKSVDVPMNVQSEISSRIRQRGNYVMDVELRRKAHENAQQPERRLISR